MFMFECLYVGLKNRGSVGQLPVIEVIVIANVMLM